MLPTPEQRKIAEEIWQEAFRYWKRGMNAAREPKEVIALALSSEALRVAEEAEKAVEGIEPLREQFNKNGYLTRMGVDARGYNGGLKTALRALRSIVEKYKVK
jgi:hypothetical protein